MNAELPDLAAAGLLEGVEGEVARQERVRLLEQLLADGFSLAELQEAARRDRLALLPVDRVLRTDDARYSSQDIAERAGLPLDLLVRLWRALGLAEAEPTEVVFGEADLEAARMVGQFHAAGLGEEPLALVSQVLGHGMARLGETLREVVGEALLEAGDTERTLGLRYAEAAENMVPLLTPMLGYVLSVHLREQLKTDIIEQAELVSGRFEDAREMTICFADLVGFTRLGERVPPGELAAAGRRLTDLAVEAARPPVRLVKMIGDAAMLVSPEPEPLIGAALELSGRAEHPHETIPALRIGIASGQAVVHCGDWLGAPVNLASRVTDVARPASVLATREVRDRARESFAWSYAGSRRLKGVREPVALYRARPQER